MLPASDPNVENALIAYRQIGLTLPYDDVNVQYWASIQATYPEMMWAAATFANDPANAATANRAAANLSYSGNYAVRESIVNDVMNFWLTQPEAIRPTSAPPTSVSPPLAPVISAAPLNVAVDNFGPPYIVPSFDNIKSALSNLTPLQMAVAAGVALLILRR